jgi:2-polyprenyl-6-methoxyphenol hydroxylase-like FAD-dependent oxidoreductase
VRVITGAVFEAFTQSSDAVSGTIRELATGTCRTILAGYLVGADGARSRVREVMGAKMTGDHVFALNYNLIVKIPELEQHPPGRRAIMYWTVNQKAPGVLTTRRRQCVGVGVLPASVC